MHRLVIDDEFREQLGGLDEYTEFYDSTGRVVGHFVPAPDRESQSAVQVDAQNLNAVSGPPNGEVGR